MARRFRKLLHTIAGVGAISTFSHCQSASQSPLPEGRVLVFQGSSTATAIFDAQALTFGSSTALPEALGPGTSSFRIGAGINSGKVMTILGRTDDISGKTYLFDATNQSYTAGTPLGHVILEGGTHFQNRVFPHLQPYAQRNGLVFSYDANSNSWHFGGWTAPTPTRPLVVQFRENAEYFTAIMTNFAEGAIYQHTLNYTFSRFFFPALLQNGANVTIIGSGANAGKGLFVSGGGQMATTILAASSGGLIPTSGPQIQSMPYPNIGSCSTVIETGVHAGKILVVHGATSTVTSIYNANTNAFETGPALSASAGDGAHIIAISAGAHAGKFLVIHGNNSVATSLYEPSTGQFAVGPLLPFSLAAGGHSVSID